MTTFEEETFGPLATIIKAKDVDEAFALSEQSRFYLGVSALTKDTAKVNEFAKNK